MRNLSPNVVECDRLSFYRICSERFSVCRGVCVRAGAKMMPDIREASGTSPPAGWWRLGTTPDGDRFHMVNGANWFDRTVSADAAGIILTSLVINRQLWLYHDSGDEGLTQLYRMRDAQLWRHIEFHPECNAIYAALD